MDIAFVWDKDKNRINKRKHKLSFNEAKSVFYDEYARMIYDPIHSGDEDRFIILGMSDRLRILAVCHCFRESDQIIRIISARKATKQEEKQYYEKRI